MEKTPRHRTGWREWGLALLIAAPLLYLLLLHGAPIAQPQDFHRFADTRGWMGLPNFSNVASNAGFLLVGAIGVAWCRRNPGISAAGSWTAFFLGVALVCFGSGYYHWTPDDASLAWDRLPMTVAFMSVFSALLSEHLGGNRERWLLVPALMAGIASVFLWKITGDLRVYLWVQIAPFLAIVYVIAAYPGRYTHRHYLLYGVGFYALAKAAELHDEGLLEFTCGAISGHSLKHLLAAGAPCCVYLMLKRRMPLPAEGGS